MAVSIAYSGNTMALRDAPDDAMRFSVSDPAPGVERTNIPDFSRRYEISFFVPSQYR